VDGRYTVILNNGERLNARRGVNIVRIPYKDSGPATIAVPAGEEQLMFPSAAGLASHLKSGKLSGSALTSADPHALFRGLATVAAAGVPGHEFAVIDSLFAPAKTAVAIINRLNREIVKVIKSAEAKELLFSIGAEPIARSPKEFTTAFIADMAKRDKLISQIGIKPP